MLPTARDPDLKPLDRETKSLPAHIHLHGPRFVQQIVSIATPTPLLGRFHQSALYRIAMDIPQFLHAFLGAPDIEIIRPRLPESPLRFFAEQLTLTWSFSFSSRQHRKRGALFQHLHHGRRTTHLWLGDQEVNVLRHHNVADDYETKASSCLLENAEEAIASLRGIEQRPTPVARSGDKVQVMCAVSAM